MTGKRKVFRWLMKIYIQMANGILFCGYGQAKWDFRYEVRGIAF